MSDTDSLYRNAGHFTEFEKLRPGATVYFNRVTWPDGSISWLGPWESSLKAHDAADFVRMKRVKCSFIVGVTKKRLTIDKR
ncbi:hypothetical protein HJA82_29665 [Rhizobium bangladeshense]|uniref:hypothetical protein n=1 Tax=Rhizobium TaxID=379 RepID=UPI001C83077D|nr:MULTISPECIES: hypothetical protein [Rhizobium]MBX4911485.1 hypothetical protein [Rhizobium bangladeshense]MBX5130773.1 hypothetical protein [Rhizobium lentis]